MKIKTASFINSVNMFNNMSRSVGNNVDSIEFDGNVLIVKKGNSVILVPLSNIVSMELVEVLNESKEGSNDEGMVKKAKGK